MTGLRLLLVSHEFPPLAGGGAGAAANLARELAALGHEVTVLTSALAGQPARQETDGALVLRVPAARRRADRGGLGHFAAFALGAGLRGPALARARGAQAVLAFFGLPGGAVALRLRRRCGLPYVLALRGGDVPGQQPGELALWHRLAAPALRAVWRGASAVTANGPGLVARARAFEPGLAVELVPNGVDLERFSPGPAPGPGEVPEEGPGPLRLLLCGRLAEGKGLETLVPALAALAAGPAPGWTLTVAGDGPRMGWLRAALEAAGLAERTRFLGFVPREAMPGVYRRADVLVHPSHFEGQSNVVLEAMASGLAVVASDIPGCAELVRPGESGALVPPGDAGALAGALGALLARPGQAAAMGRRGRELAEAHGSWARTARRYATLLASASGR